MKSVVDNSGNGQLAVVTGGLGYRCYRGQFSRLGETLPQGKLVKGSDSIRKNKNCRSQKEQTEILIVIISYQKHVLVIAVWRQIGVGIVTGCI